MKGGSSVDVNCGRRMPFNADLHREPHTTSPVYIWDSEGGSVRLFVSGAVLSQQLIERDAPEPIRKNLGFGGSCRPQACTH